MLRFDVLLTLSVEFGELRQFLRLDIAATANSSVPSPAVLSSTSNTTAYSTPQKPNPTLDDFSSLNLTPQEMFELEEELKASGSTSSLFHPDPTSNKNHSFASDSPESTIRHKAIPTSPLNFSKSRSIGKTTIEDGEKVTRIPALEGVDKPLAEGSRDELDGIELTEEETRQLLRDLGLDDEIDAEAMHEGQSNEEPEEVDKLTSKTDTYSSTSHAYDAPPPIISSKRPATSKSESEHQAPPIFASSTSIEGPSGAHLSAPLSTIEPLHLSATEVTHLKESTRPDSSIVVEDRSTGVIPRIEERRVVDVSAARPTSISTVKEVKDLKATLNHDQGDTGAASTTLRPVGQDMDERHPGELKGEGGFL